VGAGVAAAVAAGVAVLAGGVELALGAVLEQARTSMAMTTVTAMKVDLLWFEFMPPPLRVS
jgi:hypothetical protein